MAGWSKRPTAFVGTVRADVEAFAVSKADQAARDVIYKAPMDTSRFLSNMNFSVNKPNESFDENSRDVTRSMTLANARSAMAAFKSGDIFYITNVTPYGKYLEFGTEKMDARPTFRDAFNKISGD